MFKNSNIKYFLLLYTIFIKKNILYTKLIKNLLKKTNKDNNYPCYLTKKKIFDYTKIIIDLNIIVGKNINIKLYNTSTYILNINFFIYMFKNIIFFINYMLKKKKKILILNSNNNIINFLLFKFLLKNKNNLKFLFFNNDLKFKYIKKYKKYFKSMPEIIITFDYYSNYYLLKYLKKNYDFYLIYFNSYIDKNIINNITYFLLFNSKSFLSNIILIYLLFYNLNLY